MYIAFDNTDHAVSIEHADPAKTYYCPACKEKLIQKRGRVKAHHFAHTVNTDCLMNKPMTEWHLRWQREFPDECREVVFRHDQFGIRRADISIRDLIVEFQHSRISVDEITERTRFYRGCGKQIWWVFDRAGEWAAELLEQVDISVDPYKRITGKYMEPNPLFAEGTISSENDIAVFDYGGFCIILGHWIRNEKTGVWDRAASAYIVTHKFLVDMVLDPAVSSDANTFDVDKYMEEKGLELDAVTAGMVKVYLDERTARKYVDMLGAYVLLADVVSMAYEYPYLFYCSPKTAGPELWHEHIFCAEKHYSWLGIQALQIEAESKHGRFPNFHAGPMRIERITPALVTFFVLIDILYS